MSEELEKEVVEQKEEVIETDDTEVQDDNQEPDESAESDEKSAEEDDVEGDDNYEEEVLKQYSLPHKSVKELAEAFNSLNTKVSLMEKFQERKPSKDEEETPNPFNLSAPKKSAPKSYEFSENPVDSAVSELLQSGRLAREAEPQFRAVANLIDSAIAPQFNRVQEFMYQVAAFATKQQQMLKELTWKSLNHPHKGVVQKEMLDKLMGERGIDNYDDALNFYLMKTNPALLASLTEKAKDEGRKEGFKKLKRLKANKRGAPVSVPKLSRYQDKFGNIDKDRLIRDFGSEEKAAAFLDKYAQ